jgi:hypothetical protein
MIILIKRWLRKINLLGNLFPKADNSMWMTLRALSSEMKRSKEKPTETEGTCLST